MNRVCSVSSLTACLTISLTIAISGCRSESDWQAKTYPVRGVLKVNGSPAEGAMILLFPTGQPVDRRESKPWAMVEPDGTYRLTTYEQGDGAPEGEFKLVLHWPVGLLENESDRLKGKYSDLEKPVMIVQIQKDDNELPPMDLKP